MYTKLTIVGNLGRDPEMKYMPSGQAVTNINVATNRTWKDKDGTKQTETQWYRVSIWGGRGETVNQYLRKGSKVLIEGRLLSDPESGGPKIFTRNDGTAGANFEMVADNVIFLSSKREDQANNPDVVDEDDIPF